MNQKVLIDRRKKTGAGFWARSEIFDIDGLNWHDISVYLFLCSASDENGQSCLGKEEIAAKCKISVGVVELSLKNLERKGLLEKTAENPSLRRLLF
ncbi:MAG: helix-turn-helix domain-containing protein [Peptococcaceae bacterium]|jgi:predicted transcriptional regulator|nr:helix-turn-helix domain-containing protein [Peptococcaceae bacterium]